MLTPKMLKLYRLMEDYKDRNGVMPSYDEMVEMYGAGSKSNIARMIVEMEARGVLKRLPSKARAIQLLGLR